MSVLSEVSREDCYCRVSLLQQTLYQSDAARMNARAKCKTHSCPLKRAMMIIDREIIIINYVVYAYSILNRAHVLVKAAVLRVNFQIVGLWCLHTRVGILILATPR